MQGNSLYVIYALIFVVVVMLVEGIYLLISDPAKDERIANKRMALINETDDDGVGLLLLSKQNGSALNQRIAKIIPNLNSMLWAANVSLTVSGFLMISFAVFLAMFFAFTILGNLSTLLAIPLGLLLGIAIPYLFLSIKASRRRKLFGEQLCPAIDLVCRSLQAGHPAVVALEMVSKEMPDPIGTEFGIAMDQTNYGMDRNVAMSQIAERFPNPDLRFFISALEIQRSTGANLVEILGNLTTVIRNRIGMRKKVKAMSSEGRFTALIVGVLPFAVALILSVMNPGHFTDYATDPLQMIMLGIPAVMYVIGMFWLWRMVNIKI